MGGKPFGWWDSTHTPRASTLTLSLNPPRLSSTQELFYRVRNSAKRSEHLTLLNNVSGYMLPGQLSALVRVGG